MQSETIQNTSTSERFNYVKYDDKSMSIQNVLKTKFEELEQIAGHLAPGRATNLVLTKLEEAYMWCGKSIRDSQIQRNGSAELQESRTNS